MKKILSVGEATLDSFLFLSEANAHCNIDTQNCELCIKYASKTLADKLDFSVGGNAANTAVSFARLGLKSQLYSIIGTDWVGDYVLNQLKEEGVDLTYCSFEPGPTSYASILVFQGEKNLIVYHVPRSYQLPVFSPVDWLYLTSMGKNYRFAYEQIERFAKKEKLRISFNPGSYQLKAGPKALSSILKITEVLFVNRDEASGLTGLDKSEIRPLVEGLFDLGPNIVVITDGSNGSYSFDGRTLLFMPILPTKVIDTTGAGDSFASGFTAALVDGQDLEQAMRWGTAVSGQVVTKVGAQAGLVTKEELTQLLEDSPDLKAQVIR